MDSLTSLIRDADPGDPLAVALRAMLESGLIVFSRDSDGHFVQLSETLAGQVGLIARRGDSQPPNMRVFNAEGRLLPGAEYPASIARSSGTAQRGVRIRLDSDDDRSIWLQMSTMPLVRGSGGWSVLTIGADITDLQEELVELRSTTSAQEELLHLATALAGRSVTFEESVELLRAPMAALVPEMNVGLGRQVGADFEALMIHQSYGPPRPGDRGRFQEGQRGRWSANAVHVNQNVHDTDIYGASVIAEIPTAVRALVSAPLVGRPDGQLSALWAHSETPNGFSERQVEGLELVGRLLGASMAEHNEPLGSTDGDPMLGGDELAQAS